MKVEDESRLRYIFASKLIFINIMFFLDLGDSSSGDLKVTKTWKFTRKHATGSGEIVLHRLVVERGMSWKESQDKYLELIGKHEGYYLSNQVMWCC